MRNPKFQGKTTVTYAALAYDVYRSQPRPILPLGWELYLDCPPELQKEGYFGAVYWGRSDDIFHSTYFILAHRGTANTYDVYEDFLYWLKKTPDQYESATKKFILYFFGKLKENYLNIFNPNWEGETDIGIYFTGHSLGAILAQLSIADVFNFAPFNIGVQKIIPHQYGGSVFESPGAKNIIEKMMKENKLPEDALQRAITETVIHNADINAINTCEEQVVTPEPPTLYSGFSTPYVYHKDPLFGYPLYSLEEWKWYFFWDFTIKDQHSMEKMYEIILNDIERPTKNLTIDGYYPWPIGFEEAFKYYLNYKPVIYDGWAQSNHKKYWDSYMKFCWEDHLEIHEYYHNDENKFYEDFSEHFLRHDHEKILIEKVELIENEY